MPKSEEESESDQIAPRPRPGYRSVEQEISTHVKSQFVASLFQAVIGVICLLAALLWLPPHMVTPILSGVSILMMVSGCYKTWRVGVGEPRLAKTARIVIYSVVLATLLAFAATAVLGAGAFAPTFREVAG